ncbi:Cyclopropane-fatty-acyl-phospholipid synthase [Mycobacterium parascrofulaceum ATCC BAA-614]|uniref:Cyclopropane-fatty-acyl-phospholipid synthase n=1 Tax=Mycobacterium parascrofulaceum ATCC BAA-614 TaxID=525368 RepID=D5P623_9MYCO|nr:cyclopropane mycolic acid synthase family methyltransferase [Mycobacterium parascrofulaceum]EFG78475.1 Cyclopropane-fatty-acyl-phospholipid synthase [Mycobacterium parascrofulaceum ATCC BAA-614]
MAKAPTGRRKMRPHFEDVQAHYDLSDDFFGLCLDPTRTYSCAYFRRGEMTLQEAQLAKIDVNLDKLQLQPGMTVLDVGCGWGSAMARAVERYDVNVIGLTLSKNQHAYSQRLLDHLPTERSRAVYLRGWEEFDEPVDRIVSIEAFEAFGKPRYAAFFEQTYRLLPRDGRMEVQTIFTHPPGYWHDHSIAITISDLKFMRFIAQEIFPGGEVPSTDDVVGLSRAAGFVVEQIESLNSHYVRTLDTWAANLAARRDEAIAVTSEEVYQRYRRYLTGCADFFRRGITEVAQFTFTKD